MRTKLIILALLLLQAVRTTAQKTFFDSKYVKVGVVCNKDKITPSFSNNSNIRYLGNVNIPFEIKNGTNMKSTAQKLTENGIGKQVLDLLLQRDANGLHLDRLYAEALGNTTIEEINEASLDISAETKDVLKKEISRQLMKKNFIVMYSDSTRQYYIFKAEIDDRIIEQAFNTWRDMERYDLIKVPVTFKAKIKAKGWIKEMASAAIAASGYTNDATFNRANGELIRKIAEKVPDFAMRSPVYSRHPFFTRIGENQGIHSGDLLYIYRTYSDKDNAMYSKKVCSVRATEVYADSTRLYTISGKLASWKRGDIAVYKGPHRWSLSAMGQASFGNDSRFGARLLAEYKAGRFRKQGFTNYFLLGADFNTFKKEPKGVWWDADGDPTRPVLMNAAFNLGYGIGFHFLGKLELMPYILAGPQITNLSGTGQLYYDLEAEEWTEIENNLSLGITGHAGLRLNVNLWYPLQLTVGSDYNYSYLLSGDKAIYGNHELKSGDKAIYDNHELNRINFYAGLRFNF